MYSCTVPSDSSSFSSCVLILSLSYHPFGESKDTQRKEEVNVWEERTGQEYKNTRSGPPGPFFQLVLWWRWGWPGHVFLLLPFSNLSLGKEETEDMPTVGKPTSSSPPNTNWKKVRDVVGWKDIPGIHPSDVSPKARGFGRKKTRPGTRAGNSSLRASGRAKRGIKNLPAGQPSVGKDLVPAPFPSAGVEGLPQPKCLLSQLRGFFSGWDRGHFFFFPFSDFFFSRLCLLSTTTSKEPRERSCERRRLEKIKKSRRRGLVLNGQRDRERIWLRWARIKVKKAHLYPFHVPPLRTRQKRPSAPGPHGLFLY